MDLKQMLYTLEQEFLVCKNNALISCCTEQHINGARQAVIQTWGQDKLNLPNICLMQVVLICNVTQQYWESRDPDGILPFYVLTQEDWNSIGAICKEADTTGEAFGGGIIGATAGFLFGGLVGAVIGGISGAAQGNNSAINNKERYYNVLRNAIDKFFNIVIREMKKQLIYAARYLGQ